MNQFYDWIQSLINVMQHQHCFTFGWDIRVNIACSVLQPQATTFMFCWGWGKTLTMNLWLPLKVAAYSKVLVAQHRLNYFMNKYEKTIVSPHVNSCFCLRDQRNGSYQKSLLNTGNDLRLTLIGMPGALERWSDPDFGPDTKTPSVHILEKQTSTPNNLLCG